MLDIPLMTWQMERKLSVKHDDRKCLNALKEGLKSQLLRADQMGRETD